MQHAYRTARQQQAHAYQQARQHWHHLYREWQAQMLAQQTITQEHAYGQ